MQDFSRCLYDPFAKDTVERLEQLPEFNFTFKDKAKIIAYLILVYDYNNRDWQKQFTRHIELKREAALLAGFKIGANKHFSEEVEDFIVGNNAEFNKAVIRYLYLCGIPELPALVAHRELQSAEMEAAFGTTDPKDRKIIRENIDKGTERIAEYEEKVFGGKEVENLRKELYKNIEAEKIRLRPEHIAEDISKQKLDLPDPYEFND